MASAQVLRKQEHLEAGKKKLEEFRRKKAAEKAKRTTSTTQTQSFDGVQNDKQESVSDVVHINNSGVSSSDAREDISVEGFNIPNLLDKEIGIKADGFKNAKDGFIDRNDVNGSNELLSVSSTEKIDSNNQSSNPESHSSSFHRYVRPESSFSEKIDGSLDISSYATDISLGSTSYDPSQKPFRNLLPNDSGARRLENNNVAASSYPEFFHHTSNMNYSSYESEAEQKFPATSAVSDRKSDFAIGDAVTANHSSKWSLSNGFSHFNSEAQNSSNHAFASPPVARRESRPSFLDSFQTSNSLSRPLSLFDASKTDQSGFKVSPVDVFESSVSVVSANSSISNGDISGHSNYTKSEGDIFIRRQNEDFAVLEQHIEDLTQEKFSLQRELEASRTLANSLATENSALTENFNQQGSIVNQLKLDSEMLQGEIRGYMEELRALKEAYVNAQMECTAADERAKLLASEVIELEEKALRLRSNELKVERQLENSHAEISSYRKKISSLEKDREDILSTINALQEEKKLLQTKLRNASSNVKTVTVYKNESSKKDVSTSTGDLDPESGQNIDFGAPQDEDTNSHKPSLDGLPMDHRRMISNINTLIAEVALEKDQLTQALSAESSRSSKLLELNKELTTKLEVQTQRLELLTSQSLARDNRQHKQLEHHIHENTYVDEGDEVVERVLGWIMKLFPGGPSRRRSL